MKYKQANNHVAQSYKTEIELEYELISVVVIELVFEFDSKLECIFEFEFET